MIVERVKRSRWREVEFIIKEEVLYRAIGASADISPVPVLQWFTDIKPHGSCIIFLNTVNNRKHAESPETLTLITSTTETRSRIH